LAEKVGGVGTDDAEGLLPLNSSSSVAAAAAEAEAELEEELEEPEGRGWTFKNAPTAPRNPSCLRKLASISPRDQKRMA
jgi:hypothetical protein